MMSWSTHDQNGKEKENEIGIGRVHRLWERKTLKTMEVQIIQKEYVIRKRARMNKGETSYQKEKREIEKERKKRDGKDKEKREMERKRERKCCVHCPGDKCYAHGHSRNAPPFSF